MLSRKLMALLLFLLTITLPAAQLPAAEAEPAGEEGLKLVPYHIGHMVFNMPESMSLHHYAVQLPWTFQPGGAQDIILHEEPFDDPANGEKIFLENFQKRFERRRMTSLDQRKEEALGDAFESPAKMLSFINFDDDRPTKDGTPPKPYSMELYLDLKFPLGYLAFSGGFSRRDFDVPIDEPLKDAKIKEFLEAVKSYLATYRWIDSRAAINSSTFKTRFGEIDTASSPANPGFVVSFQDERKIASFIISSSPIFAVRKIDRVEDVLLSGIYNYSQEMMTACDCLPFVAFRPRAVAGRDGYELVTVVRPGPANTGGDVPSIDFEWVEDNRRNTKVPPLRMSMWTPSRTDQDPLKNYPELLSIWNTVLNNAQNAAAQ
ncbi:MAG: hypothetical protein LBV79_01090 [Candidatus Adiutrix sp.]|nr:hypothetical protein [Candidatus Adiutrix sp.]